MRRDADVRHLARRAELGRHAAAAKRGLGGGDRGPAVLFGVDDGDELRALFVRVAVVNAVHGGEDDKLVRVYLRGDKAGKLVVVGEHQLFHRHAVVFVDDGDDVAVGRNLAQQPCDVEIVLARVEILLGEEKLGGRHFVGLEEFGIGVHQLVLAHAGENLLFAERRAEFPAQHLRRHLAARGDCARADEHDVMPRLLQLGDLPHECLDGAFHQGAVGRQYGLRADLDNDIHNDRLRIIHMGGFHPASRGFIIMMDGKLGKKSKQAGYP